MNSPGFQLSARCWAEISHAALSSNLEVLRKSLPDGAEPLAIVKADAYGHGATFIAPWLSGFGVRLFGVASLDEAVTLRIAGIQDEILLLGGIFEDQIEEMVRRRLTPVVYSWKRLEALARRTDLGAIPITIKIDTGMGRLGFPFSEIERVAEVIALGNGQLQLAGVMSHAADADDPEGEAFTRDQMNQFHAALALFERAGLSPRHVHLSNSAVALTGRAGGSAVRAGLMLYGYGPAGYPTVGLRLKPVMSFKTRILQINELPAGHNVGYGHLYKTRRPSRIATLAAGYADGIPWAMSGKGQVIVAGLRAPVVGRVSMDYMAVDVTDLPDVKEGMTVTLLGQEDRESIDARDWARWAGTLPYEILCQISARVPRLPVP